MPSRISSGAPTIAFITGVDADFFGQLFLLLGSLRHNSPGLWLHVCDLGLTDPQCNYLQRTGRLLARPANRRLTRHPWYDKAALGAYTEGLNADFLVWFDADLIILNDIVPLVQDLCVAMQAENQIVAAAPNPFPLGALHWLDRTPAFKRAISSLDMESPYLNSGVIICNSREFLARWAKHCESLPFEYLFEQNAFNLTAYEQPERIRVLDPWIWNLLGPAFRAVQVVPTGPFDLEIIGRSGRVNILHASSQAVSKEGQNEDIIACDFHEKVNDTLFRPQLKIIKCFEALVKYQFNLLSECITAEAQALIGSGFGSPGKVIVLGTPEKLKEWKKLVVDRRTQHQ
jgi:hypothetical protein